MPMQCYLVGGAVRDTLLGLAVKDRDWVVVGATPQEMVDQGYLPVGRDFPVFLHPRTREEYALARTERKSAPGYRGFIIHAAPDVTLEQDLARRDLTINAMAVEASQLNGDGNFDPAWARLTDPFHGQQDLQDRVLRNVSDAFREDPVRILRLARFAARFSDFTVAPRTMALVRAMVDKGEAAALVAERVWQEVASGLMQATPSRMLTVLHACGAHAVVLPELTPLHAGASDHVQRMLDMAAARQATLEVRFACLCLHTQLIRQLCVRLRVPAGCTALAEVAARERVALQACADLDPAALVLLLERCDAFRKPARFADLLLVMECDAQVDDDRPEQPYAPRQHMLAAQAAAQAVCVAQIAAQAQAQGLAGPQIGAMVHAARVAAVAAMANPAAMPR